MVSVSPPSCRARIHPDGAVGVIKTMTSTPAATPVNPVKEISKAADTGFMQNCIAEEMHMERRCLWIALGFKAAPRVKPS